MISYIHEVQSNQVPLPGLKTCKQALRANKAKMLDMTLAKELRKNPPMEGVIMHSY